MFRGLHSAVIDRALVAGQAVNLAATMPGTQIAAFNG
jgi:hypothetical protein